MPYDSSLDQTLFSKDWTTDNERLTVSVRSYNNGPKKLQITRESRDSQGELRFAKLGRLTKEEIDNILPLIQEATKKM